jgi:ABC-type Na+ efflux pump permease subunit
MLWTEFVIILLVLCNVSASAITREREDGTLDLLLVTPITSRYYIWGKLRGLISFAAILLIVPIGTAAMYAFYGLIHPPASVLVRGDPMVLPVMPLTGVLDLAGVMLAFCALAAMVALTMSLKVRRTISAVIGTLAVVGATAIGGAVFGYVIGDRIPFIGLIIAKASPITGVSAAVMPGDYFERTLDRLVVPAAFYLVGFLCAAVAVAVYGVIVYASYRSMVRTFDMIIRKQSR